MRGSAERKYDEHHRKHRLHHERQHWRTGREGRAEDNARDQGRHHQEAYAQNHKAVAKRGAKEAAKQPTVNASCRANSKKAKVLDLLRRKAGATIPEIAKATGWQNHSIRGFVSGTVGKRMKLPVASFKNESGERAYRIEK